MDFTPAAIRSFDVARLRAEVDRARPLLEALGRGINVVGEEARAANVVKLAGNFVLPSSTKTMIASVRSAQVSVFQMEK